MDIQFWVWLIVIVVTLIARANKKKQPQSFDPEQREIPHTRTADTKPVTFEDLLREIQASKAPKPKHVQVAPKQVPSRQYEVEDYDDNLGDENKTLERTDYYANDKFNETYENAKKAAFSRASLEETMKVEDTEVKYDQFKEYSKKESQSLASEYAKELKNPKTVKRAIILNEILTRRF